MTTSSTGTVPNIFGFDGGVQLANSPGLYYFGARLYDPLTGGWTQPDPDFNPKNPASDSPYEFADGDPIDDVDPTGDITWKQARAIAQAICAFWGGTAQQCEQLPMGSVKNVIKLVDFLAEIGDKTSRCLRTARCSGSRSAKRATAP